MKPLKILLVRTDRIGDVVLVTPTISILRKKYPDAYISMLVNPYTADILKNNPDLDEVIVEKRFLTLLEEIKTKKFDITILFFVNLKVAILTLLAGIPVRIGPASKIWSIFLTKRIFQHRSKVEKHEADYNIDLLKVLGITELFRKNPKINLKEEEKARAKKFLLDNYGIEESNFVIGIHPGSRDSAKNWPKEKFAQLSDRIIKEINAKVLFTGGATEKKLLENIADMMIKKPIILDRQVNLREFIALISQCKIFIANSTGPLHIAVALNIPTVSFHPPIKVCSSKRWEPYGNGHIVFTPIGPECSKCIGKKCVHYDCMDLISVEDVFAQVQSKSRKFYDFGDTNYKK